jgi:hypothetical protein
VLHAIGVGFVGLAIAYALGTLAASIVITLQVRQLIRLRVMPIVKTPILSGVAAALSLHFIAPVVASNVLCLIVTALVAIGGALFVNVGPARLKLLLTGRLASVRQTG